MLKFLGVRGYCAQNGYILLKEAKNSVFLFLFLFLFLNEQKFKGFLLVLLTLEKRMNNPGSARSGDAPGRMRPGTHWDR